MTHTKGPWKVRVAANDREHISGKPGDRILCTVAGGYIGQATAHNARLIAAAPELLEALKMFVNIYPFRVRNHPDVNMALTKAEAALAAAEGRGV